MSDTTAAFLAVGFMAAILIMFAFGLKRGKRVQTTNEQIEANQRRMIDMQQRQLAAAERSAAAMERIADSLEKRV